MKKIMVFLLVAVLLGGLSLVVIGEDIQRGGTITITGKDVERIEDPALYTLESSNAMRLIAEYLTYTDENNITHPWLLKEWEASEDLLTWTLYCRQGILFNNGDEFTADDVVFNIKRWLDPEVGSSMLGLIGSYLSPDGIEKVDRYTVKLHLREASIALPIHLNHYPAQIMNHRTFEGDFIKAPVGTGPFVLEKFSPGEEVVLVNRNTATREDGSSYPPYWREGADGKPLPYVDKVMFLDTGEEPSAHVAALRAGIVDFIETPRLAHYLALKDDPNVQIISKATAEGRVIRMRVDREPWDDNVVRTALKLCVNHEKMVNTAYYGQGIPGSAYHVSPIHPSYCAIEPLPFDPQKAKQMLEEAGYTTPIKVGLSVGSGWEDIVSIAQILKQDAAPAFDITIKTMPISAYWDVWTECDFGITSWSHRPLATNNLALAYTCDQEGNPVPWNETRWCDAEFANLLAEAQRTLDTEKRREVMCELEKIQQERGSISVAYWRSLWAIGSMRLQNMVKHPTSYDDFLKWAWLKE